MNTISTKIKDEWCFAVGGTMLLVGLVTVGALCTAGISGTEINVTYIPIFAFIALIGGILFNRGMEGI